MELTLRRQKTLFLSFFFCFRDPNDVQKLWKIQASVFWKEEDLGAKGGSKRRPEGRKRVAHAATVPGSHELDAHFTIIAINKT